MTPLGPHFWKSDRVDTGCSLGEAVSFTLCCLLADAKERIEDVAADALNNLEVGFSFPNWLVDRGRASRVAARNFCEAVAVSIHLFSNVPARDLPRPKRSFPIDRWKELVEPVRSQIPVGSSDDLSIENMTMLSFGPGGTGVSWRFLVESAAAGLPYLRATRVEEVPGAQGLAKLLVADIGAGSTDVGYMLKVRNRQTQQEGFYYFQPASSFPWAGNQLTEEIMKHYKAKGTPLGYREAEAQKLRRTDWVKLPFVEVWKTRICEHIREYVEGIPDHRWLPLPVSLNVVVTGGSGLVPGLQEDIKRAVCTALSRRSCDRKTIDKVRLSGEHLPRLDFTREAEYARRAVCLGAADQDKPGVRFMPKMDAPTRIRVSGPPRWV